MDREDFELEDVIDIEKLNEMSREILEDVFNRPLKPVEAMILGDILGDATRKTVRENVKRTEDVDLEEFMEVVDMVDELLAVEEQVVDPDGSEKLSDEDVDYIN